MVTDNILGTSERDFDHEMSVCFENGVGYMEKHGVKITASDKRLLKHSYPLSELKMDEGKAVVSVTPKMHSLHSGDRVLGAIEQLLKVPTSLKHNIHVYKTVEGLVVEFSSVYSMDETMRSLAQNSWKILIEADTIDGRTIQEGVTFKVERKCMDIELKAVKKPLHYTKLVTRLNTWFIKNEDVLVESAESGL